MRATKAIIDLQALKANAVFAKAQSRGSKLISVIKADAYGHGALEAASALDTISDAFAVAFMQEAKPLLNAGITKPILILEGFLDADDQKAAQGHAIWPVVHTDYQLSAIVKDTSQHYDRVFVKVDTGMHRLGLSLSSTASAIDTLRSCGHIGDVTLMTHLACADMSSDKTTDRQLEAFQSLSHSLGPISRSLSNSAGILSLGQGQGDYLRAGLMLYGADPFADDPSLTSHLQAVMHFEAPIIAIRNIVAGQGVGYGHIWVADRPSTIATLAAGYADGYPRRALGTEVYICDQLAPVVGRVSMDMLTIDITDIPAAKIGDLAELWGTHIAITDVATCAGTLAYELMTGVSKRVPRCYK